jgi:hypothetical protein
MMIALAFRLRGLPQRLERLSQAKTADANQVALTKNQEKIGYDRKVNVHPLEHSPSAALSSKGDS